MKTRAPKTVLIYATENYLAVQNLYESLRSLGHWSWMDRWDIVPGRRWNEEIEEAIRTADFFVPCVTRTYNRKRGPVRREREIALEVARTKPRGSVFIIPVRLEACAVPDCFREWQWIDLFDEKGFNRLVRVLTEEWMTGISASHFALAPGR